METVAALNTMAWQDGQNEDARRCAEDNHSMEK